MRSASSRPTRSLISVPRSIAPAARASTTCGMSVRVRAPNEPTRRISRRTMCVISISAAAAPAPIPTATTLPPSRTILNACWTVCGRPSASNATSTPSPPVSSRTAATGSPSDASTTSVAPSASAAVELRRRRRRRRSPGWRRTRVPAATMFSPTPPAATTATRSRGRTAPGVGDGAVGGEHGAAEDGGARELDRLGHREDVGRRHHGVLGEPRHRVHRDRRAVGAREPASCRRRACRAGGCRRRTSRTARRGRARSGGTCRRA